MEPSKYRQTVNPNHPTVQIFKGSALKDNVIAGYDFSPKDQIHWEYSVQRTYFSSVGGLTRGRSTPMLSFIKNNSFPGGECLEPQTTSPSNLFWDLGFHLCLKPFLLVYSNRLVIFGVLQGVTSQFEQRDPVYWLKFFTGNTLTSKGAGSTGEWNHQRHKHPGFPRKLPCSNGIAPCSWR